MRRALLGVLATAVAATLSTAPAQALPRAKWHLASGVGFGTPVALGDGNSVLVGAGRGALGQPEMCIDLSRRVNGRSETWWFTCQRARYVISPHPPWRAHAAATLRTPNGDVVVDGWWQGRGSLQPDPYVSTTYSPIMPVVVSMTLSKRAFVRGSIVLEGRRHELRGHPGFMHLQAPM